VFLAASIPSAKRSSSFQRVPGAHVWIPEAVIALTRAILSHGGELVMGAHPTISPLIAQVAGEYRVPAVVEGDGSAGPVPGERREPVSPPIIIYQSRAFEHHVPKETLFLENLGYARLIWTDVIGNEKFNPKSRSRKPPVPKSLRHMRERMLGETKPDGMVCIGGMEGVLDEARLFAELRPGARIYALASTGGAASLLSDQPVLANKVRTIDSEILLDLAQLRSEFPIGLEGEPTEKSDDRRSQIPPEAIAYPLVMQTIVDELGEASDLGTPVRRGPTQDR